MKFPNINGIANRYRFGLPLFQSGNKTEKRKFGEVKLVGNDYRPAELEILKKELRALAQSGSVRNLHQDLASQTSAKLAITGFKIPPSLRLSFDPGFVPLKGILKKSGLDLQDLNFIQSELPGVDLSNLDLSNTMFTQTKMPNSKFDGSDLSAADLSKTQLYNSSFIASKLDKADLSKTEASATDFSGASLVGADLRGANLISAKFSGANLKDADLRGANLDCAIFDFKQSDYETGSRPLEGMRFDNQTKLNRIWSATRSHSSHFNEVEKAQEYLESLGAVNVSKEEVLS